MDILFYVVVVLLLSANLYFVTRKDDSDEKEDEYLIKGIVSELIDNEESQIHKLLNKSDQTVRNKDRTYKLKGGYVRLTEYSHGAGWACKLSQKELAQVLKHFKQQNKSDSHKILVGLDTPDDGGVIELQSGIKIIQTVSSSKPTKRGD